MFTTASINKNIPCESCGYNLRGLDPGGCCPECGLPIAESLRPERLLFADYRWLQRVAQGATVLTVACTGLLVSVLLFSLATVAPLMGRAGGMSMATVFLVLFATVGLLCTLMCLIFVVGTWWVTVAEPAGAAGRITGSTRWLPRAASLCAVILIVLAFLMDDPQARPALLLGAFSLLVLIVGCCSYLAAVFERFPDAQRARQLRWSGRGLLYTGGAFIGLLPILSLIGAGHYLLASVFGIIGFVFIAALAMTLARIMSCRRPLKQVLSTAGKLGELT